MNGDDVVRRHSEGQRLNKRGGLKVDNKGVIDGETVGVEIKNEGFSKCGKRLHGARGVGVDGL